MGAGPGDPELLTIKALKAIQAATVLLVDDLVSDAIVAHASPSARIVYVGKRGGCKSTPQAFIEKLMLMAVNEGENVVRLKGGDPFIFGRGGEEVEHLRAAGVPVTGDQWHHRAGLAGLTSLGAPLTHREHAHGVVFVTGHAKPGDTGTDWKALARTARDAKLTLVIYMGVSGAATIEQRVAQRPACAHAGGHHPARQPAPPAARHHHTGAAAGHHHNTGAGQPLSDRGGRCGARGGAGHAGCG